MLKIQQMIPLPHFHKSRSKLEVVQYEKVSLAVLESCINLQPNGSPVGTTFFKKSSKVVLGREGGKCHDGDENGESLK